MSVSMRKVLHVKFHDGCVRDLHDVVRDRHRGDVQHDDGGVLVGGLGHERDVGLPYGLGISLLCGQYVACQLGL